MAGYTRASSTFAKHLTPSQGTSCGSISSNIGVQGKMLDALKSYYANVRVCVWTFHHSADLHPLTAPWE